MQISFFFLVISYSESKSCLKKKKNERRKYDLEFWRSKKKNIKTYLFTPLSCSWQHTYQLVPIESHTLSAPPSLSNFWVYWPVSYAMCLICIWSTVTTVSSYFQKLRNFIPASRLEVEEQPHAGDTWWLHDYSNLNQNFLPINLNLKPQKLTPNPSFPHDHSSKGVCQSWKKWLVWYPEQAMSDAMKGNWWPKMEGTFIFK